jgi:hypothetical protein
VNRLNDIITASPKIEYWKYAEDIDDLTIFFTGRVNRSVDLGKVIIMLNEEDELVGIEIMGFKKICRY